MVWEDHITIHSITYDNNCLRVYFYTSSTGSKYSLSSFRFMSLPANTFAVERFSYFRYIPMYISFNSLLSMKHTRVHLYSNYLLVLNVILLSAVSDTICFRNITRRWALPRILIQREIHFHNPHEVGYLCMYGILSNKLMIRNIDMILLMRQLSNSSPDGICILLFSDNHNGNWATCHTICVCCHLVGNLKKIESFLNALSCHLP